MVAKRNKNANITYPFNVGLGIIYYPREKHKIKLQTTDVAPENMKTH